MISNNAAAIQSKPMALFALEVIGFTVEEIDLLAPFEAELRSYVQSAHGAGLSVPEMQDDLAFRTRDQFDDIYLQRVSRKVSGEIVYCALARRKKFAFSRPVKEFADDAIPG